MTDDITYIDQIPHRIVSRDLVSYPMSETEAERKARGDGPMPMIEFMACKVERVK